MKKKYVFSIIFLSSLLIISSSASAFDWGGGGGGSSYTTLKGYVRKPSGTPISGAIVYGEVGGEYLLTVTSSTGYYEISFLIYSTKTAYVHYQKPKYHKITQTKSVTPGVSYWMPTAYLGDFHFSFTDPEPHGSYSNLGSDWGRNPQHNDVINHAYNIIFSSNPTTTVGITATEAAHDIWYYAQNRFVQSNDQLAVRPDKHTITGYDGYTPYHSKCYSASMLLAGLFRAIGLPARSIQIDMTLYEDGQPWHGGIEKTDHVFAEVYVGTGGHNGWIVCCADEEGGWGWWGWNEFETTYIDDPTNPLAWIARPTGLCNVVTKVGWVYNVIGSDGWEWEPNSEYNWRYHSLHGQQDSLWTTWTYFDNLIYQNNS